MVNDQVLGRRSHTAPDELAAGPQEDCLYSYAQVQAASTRAAADIAARLDPREPVTDDARVDAFEVAAVVSLYYLTGTADSLDDAIEKAWGGELVISHGALEPRSRADARPAPCSDADGHRLDDSNPQLVPERCKDCDRRITWEGPGPYDYVLADI